jgi:hypothetical protein
VLHGLTACFARGGGIRPGFALNLPPACYHLQELISEETTHMSAPSRRPEIRRRRTRKEKIQKLKKRLARASGDADRTRLTERLHRHELRSPGQPLVKKD